MKTTHKEKLRIAKAIMTPLDREKQKSPFDTDAWDLRKKAIQQRVERKQSAAHSRAIKRQILADAKKS